MWGKKIFPGIKEFSDCFYVTTPPFCMSPIQPNGCQVAEEPVLSCLVRMQAPNFWEKHTM